MPTQITIRDRMRRPLAALATMACAIAASAVSAQPEPAVTMPAEKVSPKIVPAEVPTAKNAQKAAVASGSFKCGGVGSDESAAIRMEMKDHPLSLLFARSGGAYLADVDVTISGTQSLSFKAKGPVCLVDVLPGTYTVQAVSDGVSKSQSVTVGSGTKTVDFRF